jgi:hypothetical protein
MLRAFCLLLNVGQLLLLVFIVIEVRTKIAVDGESGDELREKGRRNEKWKRWTKWRSSEMKTESKGGIQ